MFAKLFESETLGQILVMKDYDSENDEFKVSFTVELQDVQVKFSVGSYSEQTQEEVFNKMTLESSENVIREILPPELLE